MIRQNIYLAIVRALKGLPALAWVDWQKDQFRQTDHFPDLPLPAALLDMPSIEWADALMQQQEGMLTLSIDLYVPTYAAAPPSEETLVLFDLIAQTTQVVHSLSLDDLQGFSRCSESRLNPPEGHHLMAYRLSFKSRICEKLNPSTFRTHSIKNISSNVRLPN